MDKHQRREFHSAISKLSSHEAWKSIMFALAKEEIVEMPDNSGLDYDLHSFANVRSELMPFIRRFCRERTDAVSVISKFVADDNPYVAANSLCALPPEDRAKQGARIPDMLHEILVNWRDSNLSGKARLKTIQNVLLDQGQGNE